MFDCHAINFESIPLIGNYEFPIFDFRSKCCPLNTSINEYFILLKLSFKIQNQ